MRPENFNVHALIESLQGTCDTLEGAIQMIDPDMTEDDLTEDDHIAIDNEIFLCEECGWWCETSEANISDTGDICTDCNESRGE